MQAWRAVLGDRWQGGPATLEELEAVEDRIWHPEHYPDMQTPPS